MRQNLWDRDRLLELTRKVGSLEFAVARSQTENYQLKVIKRPLKNPICLAQINRIA